MTFIINDTVVSQLTPPAAPTGDEEFVGPFNTWTQLTATGVAATDTAAIQAALDTVGSSTQVLYLIGHFIINATLTLESRQRIQIVGESPTATSITWAGGTSDVMLWLNGVSYSKICRITFDGASIAGTIAIDQSYDNVGGEFDTGNEYSDMKFMDVAYGIRGGALDTGFAETSVLRSTFLRCVKGLMMCNWNALDLFVWWCRFEDCTYAISNTDQAGNFSVYHSNFISNYADMTVASAGIFAVRDCYFYDSDKVFACFTNACNISFQRNTILDHKSTIDSFAFPHPIILQHFGTNLFLDNTIRSLADIDTEGIIKNGYSNGDTLCVGNIYTTNNPYADVAGRIHSISDTTVSIASITTAEPTLPSTPVNHGRTIYNIPSSSSAATIQTAINDATADANRSVVHIQPGTSLITTTLTIPAGSDIQIIGDGHASVLAWSGGGSGPVFHLESPARAVLRDFRIYGDESVNGIVVDDCDQEGSRVYMCEPFMELNVTKAIEVNGLNYTKVHIQKLIHTSKDGLGNGLEVVGGGANGGHTAIWTGAGGVLNFNWVLSGSGHLILIDIWYDAAGAQTSCWALVSGSGYFAHNVNRIDLPAGPGPALAITDFTGKAFLGTSEMENDLVISGSSSGGKVLAAGLLAAASDFYSNTTSPANTTVFINNQWRDTQDTTAQIAESGYNESTILEILSEYRSITISEVNANPIAAGKTDLRIYRVNVSACVIGIQLN